jgi:hypothetical protein
MLSMKRALGMGAAALALLTGGVTMAPAASAATTVTTCTTVDIGNLCLTRSDAGYNESFRNQSAYIKRLDFRLYCRPLTYLLSPAQGTVLIPSSGSFLSAPNQVSTYFVRRSAVPAGYACSLGLRDVYSGKEYRTRSI